LFQTILNRKHVRQMFVTQVLIQVSFKHTFISLNQFQGHTKLNENNIQDLTPV